MTKRDNPLTRIDNSSYWMVTDCDCGRWLTVTETVTRTVTEIVTGEGGMFAAGQLLK